VAGTIGQPNAAQCISRGSEFADRVATACIRRLGDEHYAKLHQKIVRGGDLKVTLVNRDIVDERDRSNDL